MSSLFSELKRRHVFRVGITYAVTAWVLAQIAEFLLENFGAPEWALKSLLVLLALGFPLAIVLAWAFEITPEGIKVDSGETSPVAGDNPPDALSAATLPSGPGKPAIAVLPFVDMSAERDQEYFSDGLAEELLNLLAKIPHAPCRRTHLGILLQKHPGQHPGGGG